ncbi:ATP-dependent DNA helicase pif1 [Plakobranchus ocellatus]|uniref:ATP-dependent DNA helicase PIF1 n=1 Tax=Plakobranchus ocellatus TaxID=259542 RepID=A0AAV3ZJN0_9GAST|nr:ATP-dependent DNA helicase pif1 [Plakobranchus ocellatus]
MDHPSLCCTIGVEELSSTGNILKKVTHPKVTLTLGRDEFKELQIQIDFPKKHSRYLVKEVLIHKKFVKDGKATIKLPEHKLHLMLSNCPPDRLAFFLKTLQVKLDCLKQKGFVSQRSKLLSGKVQEFDEISPLTLKDLQTAHGRREAQAKQKTSSTPLKPSSLVASSSQPVASIGRVQENRKRLISSQPDKVSSQISEAAAKRQKREALMTMTSVNGVSPSRVVVKQIQLTAEQNRVIEMVKQGKSIFFTGSAGTGKSFLLKRIIGALPPNHTFATASTGAAACHIGGTTLHSFAGIGSGNGSLKQCIELASRARVAQQWRACRHLIIDEISMVDADLFEKLETVARMVRKCDKPFGGIQLILCGDFLQLPPVTKPGETRRFCFQSEAWHNSVDTTTQLTEVKRQNDQTFIDILQKIRKGLCPEPVVNTLLATSKHCIDKEGVLATKLCTHKADVEEINISKLKLIQSESKLFTSVDSDQVYTSQLNSLCPVQAYLELKVGAQVMLCKNLDVQRGLVNGARGVVIGYENSKNAYPIVKFLCGVTEPVKPARWVFRVGGGNTIIRKQIPLKLAWAISIHKSQGMTLDCVEISLGKVFEVGQAYVALSRAKNLAGLRVLDFERSCVKADPTVLNFYSRLELKHRMMRNGVEDDNEIFRPNPPALGVHSCSKTSR